MLTAAGLGGEDQAALMEFFKGPERNCPNDHPLRPLRRHAFTTARPRPFVDAVLAEILPIWQSLSRRAFGPRQLRRDRDAGAPEYPLILAVDWPDTATVEVALASTRPEEGRTATEGGPVALLYRPDPSPRHPAEELEVT